MSPGQRIAVLTRRLSREAQASAILATCSAGAMWSADGPVFTATAGTTIANIGDAVARMNDVGPFVNPVTQATAGNRPLFSRRVNGLRSSEDFTSAFSAWSKSNITITPAFIAGPSGVGTATKVEATTTTSTRINQTFTARSTAITETIVVKQGTAPTSDFVLRNSTTAVNLIVATFTWATKVFSGAAATGCSYTDLADGYVAIKLTRSAGITVGDSMIVYVGFVGLPVNAGDNFYLYSTQDEIGAASTRYQKITTATDYDIVGFPAYLDNDGVNDTLATAAAIGVSAPNVFIGAAVRPTRATGTAEGLLSNARYSLQRTTGDKLRFVTSAQNYDSAATAFVQNAPVVVSAVFDSSYGVTHYINGVAGSVVTGPSDSATAEAATSLMSLNGASWMQGPGFAWIEARRAAPFTAAELLIWNRWLASKNGVTI